MAEKLPVFVTNQELQELQGLRTPVGRAAFRDMIVFRCVEKGMSASAAFEVADDATRLRDSLIEDDVRKVLDDRRLQGKAVIALDELPNAILATIVMRHGGSFELPLNEIRDLRESISALHLDGQSKEGIICLSLKRASPEKPQEEEA